MSVVAIQTPTQTDFGACVHGVHGALVLVFICIVQSINDL